MITLIVSLFLCCACVRERIQSKEKINKCLNHSPVFFDRNRNNSERKVLFDSDNVEDGPEFSRVND